MPAESLTQQLFTLLQRPISERDRKRACSHVLDWLVCARLGSTEPVAAKLRDYLETYAESGRTCTGIDGRRYHWQGAIALNAALGNVAEMDDVHRTSILHPGPIVIPVALAMAETLDASPQKMLDAVIVGYEVIIRIGRALGADHYRYYHNTSSCGAFGAAAAAGHLLGLSRDAFVSALGNAGSRTGGLWQMRNEAVDTKQLHNSEAARSGCQAALYARAGLRGPAYIIEGPQGFFAATSPEADADSVLSEAEGEWLIGECSFKPWPACRHTHSVIDAMRSLQLDSEQKAQLTDIKVECYRDAELFCNRPVPATTAEAKFSLQHCVAVVLEHDRPELAHFESGVLGKPQYLQWRERCTVQLAEAIDSCYPEKYGARVTVQFVDGSEQSASITDAWGDPANPLSAADLEEKAHTLLAAAGVAVDFREGLIQAVAALPEAESLAPLRAAVLIVGNGEAR